jgi:hypothetical protein
METKNMETSKPRKEISSLIYIALMTLVYFLAWIL